MKKIFWPHYDLNKELPRYGLERIKIYFEALGQSEKDIPPMFHVTGTNGKGSTTAFLKYILEANNYLVHRFTSPHIVDWNERIEVASKVISDEDAIKYATECKEFCDTHNLQLSYFEGIWAIACRAFAQNPATACVVEVGMGGRFDGTNSFDSSLVSIMTYMSLDHTKTLGATRELIAIEKAGIMKQNGITIVNKNEKDAIDVFLRVGRERNNRVYIDGQDFRSIKTKDGFVFEGFGRKLELPMPALWGEHQIDNATGAIAGLLAQDKIKISDESIALGLQNTKWIARLQDMSHSKLMQFLPQGAELILDGAHNDSGARTLKKWVLDKNNNDKKYNILIVAMLQRKNAKLFIENLEKCFDRVIIVPMYDEEKSRMPEEFKNEFEKFGWNNVVAMDGNFMDGLKYIRSNFNSGEAIRVVMSGSLYFMGEILDYERSL